MAGDTGDRTLAAIGALAGEVVTERLTTVPTLSVVNASVADPSRQQHNLPVADLALVRPVRALITSAHAGHDSVTGSARAAVPGPTGAALRSSS